MVGKGEAEAVEAIEEGGFTTEDKDIVEAVSDITRLNLTIFKRIGYIAIYWTTLPDKYCEYLLSVLSNQK